LGIVLVTREGKPYAYGSVGTKAGHIDSWVGNVQG